MAETNGFYRGQFFYIVLLLLVGSFGWSTFLGWSVSQAMDKGDLEVSEYTRELDRKFGIGSEKIIEMHNKDMKELGGTLSRIDNSLTEIKTEQRVMKELLKKQGV